MKCPVDGTVLQLSERQGVEIDYCPDCRGVWLDRGEIDKIIERSQADPRPAPSAPPRRDDDHRAGGYPQGGYPKKKKAKSLLEDLFDFG